MATKIKKTPTAAKTIKPKTAANDKLTKPIKATVASSVGSIAPTRPKRGPQVAVFIDLENTNASRENILEVFANLDRYGTISYAKVYGYSDDKSDEFEDIIAEYRIETTGKSRFRNDNVSVVDTRLVVDCLYYTDKHRPDIVFVWAGKGDLIPLFTSLVQMECKTITVDLPDFDSSNKYVDEKIRLFSQYTPKDKDVRKTESRAETIPVVERPMPQPVVAPEPEPEPAPPTEALDFSQVGTRQPKMETPMASVSAFGGRTIPQLPRKKGAPAFGVSESTASKHNVDTDTLSAEDDIDDFDDDFDLDGYNPKDYGVHDDDDIAQQIAEDDYDDDEIPPEELERLNQLTLEMLARMQAKGEDPLDIMQDLVKRETGGEVILFPKEPPQGTAPTIPNARPVAQKKSGDASGFVSDDLMKYNPNDDDNKKDEEPAVDPNLEDDGDGEVKYNDDTARDEFSDFGNL